MALKLGDLSKIPPKQKIFLTVLVGILVVVGYYYMFYKSASKQIDTLEKQLAELQGKIKMQEVIAKDLPTFQAAVADLELQLGLLLEQLPNSAEIPSLLKNISDLGKESGLEFLKFAPRGEAGKGFYAEIPVTISVTGEYHGFVLFASKVSHLPRIVNLSDIVFSQPRDVGGERMLVNINCTATTFRFLEKEGAAQGGKGKGP
ncbi:MAG TPA: type 4a pilus biogenesis protein PilO [Candidatus Deferrimicrobiaceae bacterium]|nr:type 4a pilus biogenesis protein PilO [Candidatus Deferrimicrobiaceae bacterium]